MKLYFTLFLMSGLFSFSAFAAIEPITSEQCNVMRQKGALSSNAPIQCDRLVTVHIRHYDFDGQIQSGDIVVMDAVAHRVEKIFTLLLQRKIPLHSVKTIENFNGDDKASMSANNTSAFNARPMTGGKTWSKHAYGVAIDVNPLQNPFIDIDKQNRVTILPEQSAKQYVNRLTYRVGKPTRSGMAEEMVDIFAENGFLTWGGYWNYPIDWQHFEIGPRALVNRLAADPKKARGVFEKYIADYLACMTSANQDEHQKSRAICVKNVTDRFSR